MARRRGMMRAVLGGMAAFAFGLGGVTAAAAEEPTGVVAGTVVSSADGAPIPFISVSVGNEDYSASGWAFTDENGAYRVEDIPPGDYTVQFDGSGTDYVSEYWDDAADRDSAQRLTVSAGESLEGIDAVLDLGGSISGRVMHQADGSPLEGVQVSAWSPETPYAGAAVTDEDGWYRIPALKEAAYFVDFTPADTALHPEYWDDAYDRDSATPVSVTPGSESAGIDAYLAESGRITGQVVLSSDGSPVSGAIFAHDPNSGVTGYTDTAPDGSYSLTVPAGAYVLQFTPTEGRGIAEFWDDAQVEKDATPIAVAQGQVVEGINASLDSYQVISGSVRTSGALSGDAFVEAYQDGEIAGMAYTQTDGSYELALPAGTYIVAAFANVYDAKYAPEYFDGVVVPSLATPVSLTAGADRTGVDFDLAPGGSIAGAVSADDVDAVEGAKVTVLLQGDGTWHEIASADSSGGYAFGQRADASQRGGALPAGTYTVRVELAGYCTQYYGGAGSLDDADTFALAEGETLTGKDLVLRAECAPAEPEPALALSAGSVPAGEEFTVTGTDFAPGATLTFELRSDPALLGTATADAVGLLSESFLVPADTPAGTHTLVALDAENVVVASVALEVAAALSPGGEVTDPPADEESGGAEVPTGSLPDTGIEAPGAATAAAIALLTVGLLLMFLRKETHEVVRVSRATAR